jgi:hypothetical protein
MLEKKPSTQFNLLAAFLFVCSFDLLSNPDDGPSALAILYQRHIP